MISRKNSRKYPLSYICAGLCLFFGSGVTHAAFFDDVHESTVADSIDGKSVVLKDSITSPDGNFTYVASQQEIFIFSRDSATGSLTQADVFNGASYPGGIDSVSVSPQSIVMSPDGTQLYMAGHFGYSSPATEGDAPIKRQMTVTKFDRDADTGMLTYNSNVDMSSSGFKSISQITLSDDGKTLFAARANGVAEDTDVYLITTANMESQFILRDSDLSILPASTKIKMALSPDDKTLYLGGSRSDSNKIVDPGLVAIDIDQNTNRLSVKQTVNEDFFAGLDTSVDISVLAALSSMTTIKVSDDGKFLYTLGDIETSEDNNSKDISAVGVWSISEDGTISLVRTMNKQELVFDVVGGSGDVFSFSDLELSPNGNDFLYLSEYVFNRPDFMDIAVFSRNAETGLLTYIDDNIGTTELDEVDDLDFSPDGRYINVSMGNKSRKVTVLDTAVDKAITLNTISSNSADTKGTVESNLQAIVSNNGPTDDYGVQVVIAAPANVTLSTADDDCVVNSAGDVLCNVLNLLVSDSTTFDVVATTTSANGNSTVTATASSNKLDIDENNNTDSSDITAVDAAVITPPVTNPPVTNPPVTTNPGNDDATTEAVESDNKSSGGCSIAGPRAGYDSGFLMLLLAAAGVFLRRKLRTDVRV